MVGKPEHIYKATNVFELQIQQKIEAIQTIKLQVQQNLKWKLCIQQTVD